MTNHVESPSASGVEITRTAVVKSLDGKRTLKLEFSGEWKEGTEEDHFKIIDTARLILRPPEVMENPIGPARSLLQQELADIGWRHIVRDEFHPSMVKEPSRVHEMLEAKMKDVTRIQNEYDAFKAKAAAEAADLRQAVETLKETVVSLEATITGLKVEAAKGKKPKKEETVTPEE